MPEASQLAEELRLRLASVADPAIAPGQQAYMKSTMPFRGVRKPAVRRATRAVLAGQRDPSRLLQVAGELWRDAEYREDRHAAILVLDLPPLRGDLQVLPLCKEMIVSGAWWDLVDAVSGHLASLLIAHRHKLTPVIERWAGDSDLWLRRSAIISQLGAKDRTDTALLAQVIEANLADGDFFIQKAIGWALRDFARTDPAWVRGFADTHQLSPLSRREALKHL